MLLTFERIVVKTWKNVDLWLFHFSDSKPLVMAAIISTEKGNHIRLNRTNKD